MMRLNYLGCSHVLDVLLREIHEKIEGVCSTKRKTIGLYGRGVHIVRVIILC
jgi:hypothetical protein